MSPATRALTPLQIERLLERETELQSKIERLHGQIERAQEDERPTERLRSQLSAAERKLEKVRKPLAELTDPSEDEEPLDLELQATPIEPGEEERETAANEREDASETGSPAGSRGPSLPESYAADAWPRPCPRGTHTLHSRDDVYIVPSSGNHQCRCCRREIRAAARRNRSRANGTRTHQPAPARVQLNGRPDAVRPYSAVR